MPCLFGTYGPFWVIFGGFETLFLARLAGGGIRPGRPRSFRDDTNLQKPATKDRQTTAVTESGRVIAGLFFQSPLGDVSHIEGRNAAELSQPGAQRLNTLDRDEAPEGLCSQVDVVPSLHCLTERRNTLARPQPAESSRCQ